MALPATDNFNRANSANLGSNWTTTAGNGLSINTNSVCGTTASDEAGEHWNADTFSDDQYSEATVSASGSGYNFVGVAARMNAGSGGSYYGIYGSTNAGNTFKMVNGTWTEWASNVNISVGQSYRVECEGTTIRFYKNGTLTDTRTDSSISSGAAGLCSWDGSTSRRVDDWEGGNLGGGPAALSVTVEDTLSLAEDLTDSVSDPQVSTTDSVTLNENLTAQLLSFIDVLDSITLGDTPSARMLSFLTASDAITLGDTPAATVSDPQVTVSDSLTLAEAVSVALGVVGFLNIDVSDNIDIADTITAAVSDLQLAIGDTITLSDVVALALVSFADFDISVSDVLAIADVLATRATDDFERADGPLGDDWTVTRGTFAIESGFARGNSATGSLALYNAATFGDDHYSQGTLAGTLDSINQGLAVRISGENAYILSIDSGSRFLAEVSGGTTIGKFSDSNPPSIGTVIRLEARGNTISYYENGALVTSFDDSTYTTGSPGLYGSAIFLPPTVTADWGIGDWEGGNLEDRVTVSAPQVSAADTLALAETIAALVSAPQVSAADTLILADDIAAYLLSFISTSDTITLDESYTSSMDVFVSAADSVSLSDTVAQTLISYLSVSDAMTLGESTAFEMVSAIEVADGVTVADAVSALVSDPQVSVEDTLALADSIAQYITSNIGVSDTLTIGESTAFDWLSVISVSDSLTIADVVTALVSDPQFSVSDSLTLADSANAVALVLTATALARAYVVNQEDRVYVISEDNRVLVIDNDNRVYAID